MHSSFGLSFVVHFNTVAAASCNVTGMFCIVLRKIGSSDSSSSSSSVIVYMDGDTGSGFLFCYSSSRTEAGAVANKTEWSLVLMRFARAVGDDCTGWLVGELNKLRTMFFGK